MNRESTLKPARRLLWPGLLVMGLLTLGAVNAQASSGVFADTGSLSTARWGHTATLLANGEVLATGGWAAIGEGEPLASAELYNPATGKWTVTGSMAAERGFFTATLLQN